MNSLDQIPLTNRLLLINLLYLIHQLLINLLFADLQVQVTRSVIGGPRDCHFTLQQVRVLNLAVSAESVTFIETLSKLQANDQVLFRYCDEEGKVNEEANPNGSVTNIAGVCNEKRNVFGMMPHPERAADDNLSNVDGRKLFESILSLIEA